MCERLSAWNSLPPVPKPGYFRPAPLQGRLTSTQGPPVQVTPRPEASLASLS